MSPTKRTSFVRRDLTQPALFLPDRRSSKIVSRLNSPEVKERRRKALEDFREKCAAEGVPARRGGRAKKPEEEGASAAAKPPSEGQASEAGSSGSGSAPRRSRSRLNAADAETKAAGGAKRPASRAAADAQAKQGMLVLRQKCAALLLLQRVDCL